MKGSRGRNWEAGTKAESWGMTITSLLPKASQPVFIMVHSRLSLPHQPLIKKTPHHQLAYGDNLMKFFFSENFPSSHIILVCVNLTKINKQKVMTTKKNSIAIYIPKFIKKVG